MAAGPANQQRHSLDNPVSLPFTPSGPTSHDNSDIFNVHKIRLAPLQTRRLPQSGQLPPTLAGGQAGVPAGVGLPGPVAEGLEVEASAFSDTGMSDAGSSRAGDDPQERHWGVLQAAKNAFFKRCDCTLQLICCYCYCLSRDNNSGWRL